MVNSTFQTCQSLLARWGEDVLTGNPPLRYSVGVGAINQFELRPRTITLLGGSPAAGKTAFTVQAVFDALRLNSDLRATIANVEMSPQQLLERYLARLTGIDGRDIRERVRSAATIERMQRSLQTIADISERLAFVSPPFSMHNIAEAATEFGADLILIDYIQRIRPANASGDQRSSVNSIMHDLRRFTQAGVAVIAVAAVSRTKDKAGRTSYDGGGLNLASFRESSELEFGADDAYILVTDESVQNGIRLKHLKSRYGAQHDILLSFDRACQRFTDPVPLTPPITSLPTILASTPAAAAPAAEAAP